MSTVHGKSTIERIDDVHFRKLRYNDPQHTPYTKRPFEEVSNMNLTFEAHRNAKWLSIHTEEARIHGSNVRFHSHYVTLRPEQAIALRDFLNEQFPVRNPFGWLVEYEEGGVLESHFVREAPTGHYVDCATPLYLEPENDKSEIFASYKIRNDGVKEFRLVKEAFTPSPLGYTYWNLYK